MRSRSLAAQHDAAVARRLELLTTELAAVRGRTAPDGEPAEGTAEMTVDEPAGVTADADPPTASAVRLPGRHASRRTTPAAVLRVPAWSAGHLALVAVAAVLALVLTGWWLLRSGGHEVAAPVALTTPRSGLMTPRVAEGVAVPSGAGEPSAGAGSATGAAPAATAKVVVDVTGKVRRPGIVVLHRGARVVDALRAAGGARPGVDLSGLNLARVLADGEQVVVGAPAAAGPAGPAPVTGPPVSTVVDLNTADETALESLPEVGPVTAQAIIAWRTEHGGYTSVSQLLDVDGIGAATLAKITPYVTV